MKHIDYWAECISESAIECGLVLTQGQLECLAKSVEAGHDNYGMAFYQPPSSDRIAAIEREEQSKLDRLQKEFDRYRDNAEQAVKKALNQYSDAQVSIGEHGEVTRYGGRIERIQ